MRSKLREQSIGLLSKIGAFFDGVVGISAAFAGILIIFIMLSVSLEIAVRYFLGTLWQWVIEVNQYALVCITFLSAAWVLKRDGHVAIDMVVNQLNRRAQLLVNVSTSILSLIVCAVVTWYGLRITWGYFVAGRMLVDSLTVPAALIYAVIPVGFFLFSIQFLRRIYGYLRMWKTLANKQGVR